MLALPSSQAWYYGGVLLQWRHSTLVGVASLADIIAQVGGRQKEKGRVGGGGRKREKRGGEGKEKERLESQILVDCSETCSASALTFATDFLSGYSTVHSTCMQNTHSCPNNGSIWGRGDPVFHFTGRVLPTGVPQVKERDYSKSLTL